MTYWHDPEIFEAYPVLETDLEWLNATNHTSDIVRSQPEPDLEWFDQELEGFFGSIFGKIQDTLREGKEFLAIRQAIAAGNRDANKLTNMIFFARHPERQGRKIEKTEPNYQQLGQEWLDIRDRLIIPALQSLTTQPSTPSTTSPTGKLTSFRKKAKEIAEQEWNFFGKGRKREHESGFWQRIVQYWTEGPKVKWIDTPEEVKNIPWSAAFISWVMRKAGAGNQFKYSSSHSVYIRDAIQKRKNNDSSAAFKGYRLTEVAPQVGDLVCFSREDDATKINYYDVTREYKAHCDIVVATSPGEIEVIGGNTSNSVGAKTSANTVGRKTLPVDSQGKVINTSGRWFVVIKNLL